MWDEGRRAGVWRKDCLSLDCGASKERRRGVGEDEELAGDGGKR